MAAKRIVNTELAGKANAELRALAGIAGVTLPAKANKREMLEALSAFDKPSVKQLLASTDAPRRTVDEAKAALKRAAVTKPAPKLLVDEHVTPATRRSRRADRNAVETLSADIRAGAAATAAKTAAKRRGDAPTAKRAAKRTAGATGTFTLGDFPDTFTCTSCNEERSSKSFPTVKSGQPELRKSECRRCRGLRTGTLVAE